MEFASRSGQKYLILPESSPHRVHKIKFRDFRRLFSDLLALTLQPNCCFVFCRPTDDRMKPQAPGSTQTFVIFGNQNRLMKKVALYEPVRWYQELQQRQEDLEEGSML